MILVPILQSNSGTLLLIPYRISILITSIFIMSKIKESTHINLLDSGLING